MRNWLLFILSFCLFQISIAQCNYTLELFDSAGDGWQNGSQIIVTIAGGTPTTYFIDQNTGNYQNITLSVNDQDTLVLEYTEDSVNPNENSYILYDSEGNTVVDSGNAPSTVTHTVTVNCPPCSKPFNINEIITLDTSTTLIWDSQGPATIWDVKYDSNLGFDPDVSGSGLVASNWPFEINMLNPQTSYEIYIRSNCGIDGTSDWVGPIRINTLCAPVASPFSESFDTLSTPNCWIFSSDNTSGWEINSAPNFDNSTCSDTPTDNTNNNGYFAWIDHSNNTTIATMQSPIIDVSSLSNAFLSFDYWKCSNGYSPFNELIVNAWDGTEWVELDHVSQADAAWGAFGSSIDGFTFNDKLLFRIIGISGGATNDFVGDQAIDNIKVQDSSSCNSPSDLDGASPTLTSVQLSWQDNAGSQEWELEWGPIGYTRGDTAVNNVVTGVTSPNYSLTNLSPSASYDYYVRAICITGGGFSEWVGPFTVETQCGELQAPFTQSFNYDDSVPNCWTTLSSIGDTWLFDDTGFNISNCNVAPTDHTGNNSFFAWVDHSGDDAGVILETPTINVSALNNPFLEFYLWMCTTGYSPSNELYIEAQDTSGNWNLISLINTGSASWQKHGFNISTHLNGTQTIKIRFRAESGGSIADYFGDIAIDDISVLESPSCFSPDNFILSSSSNNSMSFSATDLNSPPAVGYEVEYAIAGVINTPGTSQGTLVNTISSFPFTINGLSADTVYDFYIRSNCGNGDYSTWSGPITESTLCDALMAPYHTDFESDNINELNNCEYGLINSSSNTTTIQVDDSQPASGSNHISMDSGTDSNAEIIYVSPQFSDLNSTKQVRFKVNDKDNGNLEVGILLDRQDSSTFIPFQYFTDLDLSDDVYEEKVVSFSGYTGGAGYIAFKFIPLGTADKLFLDDIHYEEAPNCIAPSNISNIDITQNSVNLSWSPGNNETEWTLEYGLPGFTPGGTNSIGVVTGISNNSNYQLNGLIANTDYEAYLYSVCSPTIISSASSVHRFRTFPEGPTGINCTTPFNNSLIYRENFENGTPVGWTGTSFTGNADDWMITSGNQNSIETGPFQSYEGSFHLEFQSGTNSNGYAVAISPLIDLTQGSGDVELTFFLHAYGTDMGNIEIAASTISNTGPFTPIFNFTGGIQESDSSPWAPIGVDLSAYQGQQIWIQFKATSSGIGFRGDFALDQIEINACGNFCEAPDTLDFSFITDTTAEISWQDNTASNNWEIAILTSGSNPPSSPGQSINTNPYTATNLSSNTTYDVYIRTGCYANSFSNWSLASSFTTLCDPQTAPYSQNFENFNAVTTTTPGINDLFESSNCWNTSNNSLGWIVSPPTLNGTSNTGPSPQINTGNFMMIEGSLLTQTPNRFSLLESPLIDLSNLSVPELKFDYHSYGSDIGSLEVLVRTNNQETLLNIITGPQQTLESEPYIEELIDLSNFTGQIIQIIFKVTDFNGGFECDVAIDNFEVRETIVCNPISNLNATTINTNSAIIEWIDNGNASVWDLEVQLAGNPQGFTPSVFSGSSNTVSTSINGLNANSSYDIYVRADCGSGTYADWVGPLHITTLCDIITAPYIGTNTPGNNFETNLGDCWEEGLNTSLSSGPNGLDGAWTIDNFGNSGVDMAAKINLYGTTPINDWLVTPEIDLGSSAFEAIFDIAHTAFGNTSSASFDADDRIHFLISDDGGMTWNILNTWDSSSNVSNTGETIITDLSAYSGIVRMAFWGTNGATSGSDTDFFIDNFSVDSVGAYSNLNNLVTLVGFPNPVQNNFHINCSEEITELKVLNALGQTVLQSKLKEYNTTINLSGLDNGLYFIEIKFENHSQVIKVIKE